MPTEHERITKATEAYSNRVDGALRQSKGVADELDDALIQLDWLAGALRKIGARLAPQGR